MKTSTAVGLLLGVYLGPLTANEAGAAPWRYVVDVRPAKGDSENQLVTLRDAKDKRVLWTRDIFQPHVTWSKDHRAVVVEGGGGALIWREGWRLANLGFPPGYPFDYPMGCAWSPDKSRLLIRYGASGSSMVGDNGIGALFCLKFGPRSSRKWTFVANSVANMKWRDSRTVFYEALDYNQRMEAAIKSHVWRIR